MTMFKKVTLLFVMSAMVSMMGASAIAADSAASGTGQKSTDLPCNSGTDTKAKPSNDAAKPAPEDKAVKAAPAKTE
jgi:hypothetical protein